MKQAVSLPEASLPSGTAPRIAVPFRAAFMVAIAAGLWVRF
jgi:hypothetical protein